ncbi:MAG: hypothetical protein ACFB8W_23025 [Elainellaceae cyanobacterium]
MYFTQKSSNRFFSRQTYKFFISSILAAIVASTSSLLGGICQPAQAEAVDFVIERFIVGPIAVGNLIAETEPLIRNAIVSQFSQNSSASEVRVVVLGNYKGETIPVLTTVVTRGQWQEAPQVALWTRYSGASETLFARLDNGEETSGRRPAASLPVPPTSTTSIDPVVQVEEAFAEGRLTRREYQELVDALD